MNDEKQLDHLLACLGEECGEVQQVVGKSLRFGIYDKNPHNNTENLQLLIEEVHDIVAVYKMICKETGSVTTLDENMLALKQQKVIKYMDYARKTGKL